MDCNVHNFIKIKWSFFSKLGRASGKLNTEYLLFKKFLFKIYSTIYNGKFNIENLYITYKLKKDFIECMNF